MDNASNCDTTSDCLPDYIPTHRSTLSRTRCFPHTVNLIAKAFIAFFFKQPKKMAKVTVAPGKRKRGAQALCGRDIKFKVSFADPLRSHITLPYML
ncbi:hypothetical protein B0H16DRAFT_1606447 [Mycena metata]|uniref:Uncharacterized protein n=1 Tax=Mycena metata TaxID=1033252 RepID=A0AAD7HFQ0_9AGAR|nr:hypothetical protein B0H16DRAFT_1606447 [Mycena metata]